MRALISPVAAMVSGGLFLASKVVRAFRWWACFGTAFSLEQCSFRVRI
jgi:hypothetical protein